MLGCLIGHVLQRDLLIGDLKRGALLGTGKGHLVRGWHGVWTCSEIGSCFRGYVLGLDGFELVAGTIELDWSLDRGREQRGI